MGHKRQWLQCGSPCLCSQIHNEPLIKWFKPHGNDVLQRQQPVIEAPTVVTLSDFMLSSVWHLYDSIVQPTIHRHGTVFNRGQNQHVPSFLATCRQASPLLRIKLMKPAITIIVTLFTFNTCPVHSKHSYWICGTDFTTHNETYFSYSVTHPQVRARTVAYHRNPYTDKTALN